MGEEFLLVVEVLAFTSAGALVASRRPGNPIGWLLLAEGQGSVLVWPATIRPRAHRSMPSAGLP